MIRLLDTTSGLAPIKKRITLTENTFLEARDFYHAHEEMREEPITVVASDGSVVCQLVFATNQTGSEIVVKSKMGPSSNFWDYDYADEGLDLTLIRRADAIVCESLNEYTYAIARVVRTRMPEVVVCFVDERARTFFAGDAGVRVVDQAGADEIRNAHLGRVLTIVDDDAFLITRDTLKTLTYNAIQIMNGLWWLSEEVCYGEENPDKTFILIKSHLGHEGIAGVLRYVLNKLEVIKNSGTNAIPVVDLGIYGEVNQFAAGTGENVWDRYFEPLSDYTVQDVYNSQHVLLACDGMKTKNPYLYEQDLLADYPQLIGKYLTFKESTIRFCEEQMARVKPQGVTRYIGVVGRGTDYNMQLTGNLSNYLMRPLSGEDMLAKAEELFATGDYDGVFLATEDASVFETFMTSNIRDHIFYVDQQRYSYDPTDTDNRFLADIYKHQEQPRDGFAENLRYIGIIYMLSKASALLSSTLCGAAKIAWGLNADGFDYMDVPGIAGAKKN